MIKCTQFKEINKGALYGFATIFVEKWGIHISNCKIFRKNGKNWMKFPDREYEVKGEKKYSPYIWFENKELAALFSIEALEAIENYIATQPSNPEQQTSTQNNFKDQPLPF